jgi:hypothetical protein
MIELLPHTMGGESSEISSIAGEEPGVTAEIPITLGLIGKAMIAGFVGMVAYLPILVGVPVALDLFQTDPLVRFSSFVAFFGLEPSLALGLGLYVMGGTLFLPVQFIVVGAYLPPEEPRYARGVTYALIYWVGFLMVFWPPGGPVAVGVFILVSALYHVAYGLTLGRLIDRWAEIPQHAV